jgi:hypothetical protein
MRGADGEKVELPRMDALRHPQRDRLARNIDPADDRERVAHQHRRAGCARRMVLAVEPN